MQVHLRLPMAACRGHTRVVSSPESREHDWGCSFLVVSSLSHVILPSGVLRNVVCQCRCCGEKREVPYLVIVWPAWVFNLDVQQLVLGLAENRAETLNMEV